MINETIQESRKLAISEIEKFGLPNLIHFEIAEKKAIELADKLNADKTIVQIGIYLMDLKLGQAFKEDKISEHVQMSVEAAKEFLDKFDIDEISKRKIINCVEAHHGKIPFECLEAEICANADCYRFIHPKGFFVFLTTLGKRSADFYECLTNAENKMDEKYNILSLELCKQELEKYYQTLKKFIDDARRF
jgi:hypothetical protein